MVILVDYQPPVVVVAVEEASEFCSPVSAAVGEVVVDVVAVASCSVVALVLVQQEEEVGNVDLAFHQFLKHRN